MILSFHKNLLFLVEVYHVILIAKIFIFACAIKFHVLCYFLA